MITETIKKELKCWKLAHCGLDACLPARMAMIDVVLREFLKAAEQVVEAVTVFLQRRNCHQGNDLQPLR